MLSGVELNSFDLRRDIVLSIIPDIYLICIELLEQSQLTLIALIVCLGAAAGILRDAEKDA